ncbi:MAG: hypothetical protein M0Z57_06740 [Deltaproteobacteria bacterium]|jgi:hypothetical protein|uniref:DUF4282 domain-containing protein n=1 Tax=Candidatus Acidulodesulfobacterium acidiphilum TaxID=2597224 RepID=A0A520X6Y1_9DELT|nr:hypothetical protein [Deltaproteobacteria bacterium]MDA8299676.1 hypothetical protein [Deltaproteobacteria bacterium]RZV36908.1 MAG: hypothetical protein EVJ48_09780 [Candidatus Acidulodesulfobacterium acidiphilum]
MNYLSYFKFRGTLNNDSKYPALSLIAFILKIAAFVYLVVGLIGTFIMSFVWADQAGKMSEMFGRGGFNIGSALSSFFFSLIGGIIVTIVIFLLLWAYAELILVLMDIEHNTSKRNEN